MHPSARLIEFLKKWERFEPTPYCDDGTGKPTVGYGHVMTEEITPAEADTLLRRDVAKAAWAVFNLVAVKLTQNQFDVLISFVFNIGAGAFEESTLRRLLNDRKYDAVPHELARWHYERGVSVLGLVRRRAAEAAWWQEK